MTKQTLIKLSVLSTLCLASVGSAFAGWSVVSLNPTGVTNSIAYGICNGYLAGYGDTSAYSWTAIGTATKFKLPTGWTSAAYYGIYNNQQLVGTLSKSGTSHAFTSNGTTSVDLNPTSATSSYGYAVYNGKQAGCIQTGGVTGPILAGYWSGTASSWVNFGSGYAYGIYNTQVVGYVIPGGACLWNGTSASKVLLQPSKATGSEALGVYNGYQVGWATISNQYHASLWSGSATSWIDLNPAQIKTSKALAVYGAYQVGYASTSTSTRACLWNGTSASYTDLHTYLPTKYTASEATGCFVDSSGGIWVSGYGTTSTSTYNAYLWHFTPTQVSGKVAMAGSISTLAETPIVIHIKDPYDGETIETHTVIPDRAGNYSFTTNLDAGSYAVAVLTPGGFTEPQPLILDDTEKASVDFNIPVR
jgi:hypothetical protein